MNSPNLDFDINHHKCTSKLRSLEGSRQRSSERQGTSRIEFLNSHNYFEQTMNIIVADSIVANLSAQLQEGSLVFRRFN